MQSWAITVKRMYCSWMLQKTACVVKSNHKGNAYFCGKNSQHYQSLTSHHINIKNMGL